MKNEKTIRKILTFMTFFLFLTASYSISRRNPDPADRGMTVSGSIIVDGLERTYLLHIPPMFTLKKKSPLVIALHGGGGTGKGMIRLTRGGLNTLSNAEGFFVVYPDGIRRHWNDGRNTIYYSHRKNINDVKFISKLIDRLVAQFNLDRNRIYVTGISNGGLMSYRLACELTDRLAAIAAVGISLSENLYLSCKPSRPISVLIIAGMSDPLVPWNGGIIHFRAFKFGKVISVPETARFWASQNGCTLEENIKYLPDTDPYDGTRVWKQEYSGCRGKTEVILYGIENGGHTWPGGLQYFPESVIGKTSHDIDANKIIINFFKRHSKE